ncbi:2-dehydropantoate 2-reductase N-terminal domain-containing protein [Parabacteroides sp. AF17-28]|uniref:ketopantoate reductase family protein n=1 Tax=Parabacteroides sp. AF17-28 TaxID=2292241 RepID=UPI000EFF4617|nr:2-dehydropantoate 2-reductase N-terminal domain-containing protein [Parabacteroides sp. AF17-28]RHR59552.1 ketopantoate reductase family protein [Parabacteroides sp. AF17-28]
MKILIYGAGVVGCTYGWQLSKAGYDITVLVRKGQKEVVQKEGIHITCSDFREKIRKDTDIVFKPTVIDELLSNNDFEYIIVSTNKLQLSSILPILSKSAGKANVVFFQNNWDAFTEIDKYLKPEQYFFAFPFMVGGGKDDKSIHCAISGLKYSNTPLGEKDGRITPRVERLFVALDKAGLKPVISNQIVVWLITHYAVAAGLSAGIMSAGSAPQFIENTPIIKITMKAIREGLAICKKMGINPNTEKANRLYYLPLFICVPIAKKIYSNDALQLMFEGHINHSPAEIRQMIDDIIDSGVKYSIATPNLAQLKSYISS